MRSFSTNNFLLILISFISDVNSACTSFDTVDPDDYDLNYASIENDSARPLGYSRGFVSYNNPDDMNTCSTLDELTGHTVEIMFETVPSSTLCVEFGPENGQKEHSCATGQYNSCTLATSDKIQVKFYCDSGSGCSESDVKFWYRITSSPEVDYDTHWCGSRDGLYPESLRPSPSALPDPETTPHPNSSHLSSVQWTSLITTFITSIIFQSF